MKKFLYWLLPLGWMGMIFYSSSTPYQDQDVKPFMSEYLDLSFLEPIMSWIRFTYHHQEVSVAHLGIEGLVEFFIRKGAHVTVFLLLAVFFYLALRQTTSVHWKKVLLLSFLFTSVYAAFDEVHQGFTPNRTPYIGDVFLDMIGAFGGACIIFVIKARRRVPNPENRT